MTDVLWWRADFISERDFVWREYVARIGRRGGVTFWIDKKRVRSKAKIAELRRLFQLHPRTR